MIIIRFGSRARQVGRDRARDERRPDHSDCPANARRRNLRPIFDSARHSRVDTRPGALITALIDIPRFDSFPSAGRPLYLYATARRGRGLEFRVGSRLLWFPPCSLFSPLPPAPDAPAGRNAAPRPEYSTHRQTHDVRRSSGGRAAGA